MAEMITLADALKSNQLDEARKKLEQHEKLPKDLPSYDQRSIYDQLVQAKASDIIEQLVKQHSIATDLYDYDKLDGSIFESMFRHLGTAEADQQFLAAFLEKTDNINDAVNNTTLLQLAFNRSVPVELIQVLVNAGCDVHYKNNYEEGYLHKIIQEYDIKEPTGLAYFAYLLEQGLDPNAGNIVRTTPLHVALDRNKRQYVDFLLQHGADPNLPGKDGETAFYMAVVHQVCEAALYEKLSEYAPADFNVINKNGETLLGGALRMRNASERDIQLIKALVRDGADVYQTSVYYSQDKAAIDWVSEKNADLLEALLEMGVIDLYRRDNNGNTLLHKVCAYNVNYDQEAARQLYRKAKMLLEQGADAQAMNDQDQTPMDLAAQDNLKVKTVELLLKHKA